MDTIENLRKKLSGAEEIKSVVHTMKAVAASNIGQYELAVRSLGDYYRTIALGINAYLRAQKIDIRNTKKPVESRNKKLTCAIVFGSDQGLVGQFNDSLSDFVSRSLHAMPGEKEIWAVGDRVHALLSDMGYNTTNLFPVPTSIAAITPLVGQILLKSEENHDKGILKEIYIYHNQPKPGAGYTAESQRLLPLDDKWMQTIAEFKWPTKILPQVAGAALPTLLGLTHEYLFVSLFKACAASLASENASRLAAMQRAEKNIEELLDELSHRSHRLRQSTIDEELFDVISGFEALKDNLEH